MYKNVQHSLSIVNKEYFIICYKQLSYTIWYMEELTTEIREIEKEEEELHDVLDTISILDFGYSTKSQT